MVHFPTFLRNIYILWSEQRRTITERTKQAIYRRHDILLPLSQIAAPILFVYLDALGVLQLQVLARHGEEMIETAVWR